MPRRVSDHEIDEYVEAGQHARLDARRHDPRWRLVEATDGLGGLVWEQVREADTVATITFTEIAERVAAHAAAEAERNGPIVVALDALATVRAALAEMSDDERSDIRDEIYAMGAELDALAWQQFAAR